MNGILIIIDIGAANEKTIIPKMNDIKILKISGISCLYFHPVNTKYPINKTIRIKNILNKASHVVIMLDNSTIFLNCVGMLILKKLKSGAKPS